MSSQWCCPPWHETRGRYMHIIYYMRSYNVDENKRICWLSNAHNVRLIDDKVHRMMRVFHFFSELSFQISKRGFASQGNRFWVVWLYQTRYNSITCCVCFSFLSSGYILHWMECFALGRFTGLSLCWRLGVGTSLIGQLADTLFVFCRQKIPWCGG